MNLPCFEYFPLFIFWGMYCVKSVQIRSFFCPYFPAFRLNTEIYSVNLHIQSECRKIRTRKNSVVYLDTFHAVMRWGMRIWINKPYWFDILRRLALREKCPYWELFWSAFFPIWTEYGEIYHASLYSILMWENADQNNFDYGRFLRNVELKNHRQEKHKN